MQYQCIVDTGEVCVTRISNTGEVGDQFLFISSMVSMTPVRHDLTSINNTGDAYIDNVVDTCEVHWIQILSLFDTGHILYQSYLVLNSFDIELFDTEFIWH